MGVYPRPILERTEASVKAFTENFQKRLDEAYKNPDGAPRFYPAPPPGAAPAAPAAPSGETPPAAPAAPAPAPGGGNP
jgi:hypothetical protein